MKRLVALLLLLLPAALFAQSPAAPASPRTRETALLRGFGLNDAQIAQVFDIQDRTRTTVRQDAVQLRLLRAQMDKALLPAAPSMQDVNGFITQMSQTRADMMKALVGARVQLRQIIGDDNYPAYSRFIRGELARDGRRLPMRRPGEGPMNGTGGTMDGAGPRGGVSGPGGWM